MCADWWNNVGVTWAKECGQMFGDDGWTNSDVTKHCFWCWGNTELKGQYENTNVDLPMAKGTTSPKFEAWITDNDGQQ